LARLRVCFLGSYKQVHKSSKEVEAEAEADFSRSTPIVS